MICYHLACMERKVHPGNIELKDTLKSSILCLIPEQTYNRLMETYKNTQMVGINEAKNKQGTLACENEGRVNVEVVARPMPRGTPPQPEPQVWRKSSSALNTKDEV